MKNNTTLHFYEHKTPLSYRDLEYPFTTEIEVLTEQFSDIDKCAKLLSVLNVHITKHKEFPDQKELLKSFFKDGEIIPEIFGGKHCIEVHMF